MEEFCPVCKKKTYFYEQSDKKYKCKECNDLFKNCKTKDCHNMISKGWYCTSCIQNAIRKVKVGGIFAVCAIGYAVKKGIKKII